MFIEELASGIQEQKVQFPKTVIFCSSYIDCAEIYRHLRSMLGQNLTAQPSYPDLQQFWLVDMYTQASTAEMKEKIIESFCSARSKLCVIIATTAFGMGIDCPDIRKVIHWGPPSEVDHYGQEAERAGREGLPAEAMLLYTKKHHSKEKMKENTDIDVPVESYCSKMLWNKQLKPHQTLPSIPVVTFVSHSVVCL